MDWACIRYSSRFSGVANWFSTFARPALGCGLDASECNLSSITRTKCVWGTFCCAQAMKANVSCITQRCTCDSNWPSAKSYRQSAWAASTTDLIFAGTITRSLNEANHTPYEPLLTDHQNIIWHTLPNRGGTNFGGIFPKLAFVYALRGGNNSKVVANCSSVRFSLSQLRQRVDLCVYI